VIAGPTVCIHHAELGVLTQDIPELFVAEDLLSAHQLLIQRGIV
ncbi:MAG: helix-turn-helix-type transcriptional regulator, partial [Pseudomonas sp.]|nr:helix-turn-helix-type transcriptional regulator [Pseudomonas sp.]